MLVVCCLLLVGCCSLLCVVCYLLFVVCGSLLVVRCSRFVARVAFVVCCLWPRAVRLLPVAFDARCVLLVVCSLLLAGVGSFVYLFVWCVLCPVCGLMVLVEL